MISLQYTPVELHKYPIELEPEEMHDLWFYTIKEVQWFYDLRKSPNSTPIQAVHVIEIHGTILKPYTLSKITIKQ
jgi:hypothetical protein